MIARIFSTTYSFHASFRYCHWNKPRKIDEKKLEMLKTQFYEDALQQSSGKPDNSETATAWSSLETVFYENTKAKKCFYFFGEWVWHEGAIKKLVVFKHKTQFRMASSFLCVFVCGIKISFEKKKRLVECSTQNNFLLFSLSFRLSLSERNNMELLNAPFIKNFNIAEI